MSLPNFPAFIDVLDPEKTGLYPTFASTVKTTSLAVVRDKIFPLAIVAMQKDLGGSVPWDAIPLTGATVTVSIDNPDLFPSQGSYFLNDGSGPTGALPSSDGSTTVAVALNALANLTAQGGVTVVQTDQDFIVTWNQNGARALLTATTGSLYPASSIQIEELQAGNSTQPEIQCISIRQLPATIQSSFTAGSGSPTPFNGILNLNTPGMVARFDALPVGTETFDATFQVDIQFPGDAEPTTVLLLPITVHRDVIRGLISAQPPFPSVLTQGTGIESWFQTVSALSSGAGSLSGISTASGASKVGRAGLFGIAGITNGWSLWAGTNTTGPGIQLPDDYNASTNAVFWQQFI